MKRRWIALAAALMMALGLFGAFPAFAQEETVTVPVEVSGVFEGENHWADATYTYVATDGVPAASGILSNGKYSFMYFPATGQIKKNAQTDNGFFFNSGTVPAVVIPKSIEAFAAGSANYPAKEIKVSATSRIFPFNTLDTGVKTLALADGIEAVEACTFYGIPNGCRELTIKLPDSIKTIGNAAFCAAGSNGAIFNEIVIPDGVTSIDSTAFGLTRIPACTIPAGVTQISKQLFQNSSAAAEITIKGSVTSIGDKAFNGCKALKKLTFEGKTAPASFGTAVVGSVSGLTVYYPAGGTGYDNADFRALFPADTVFEPFAVKPAVLDVKVSGGNLVGNVLTGGYETFVTTDGSVESGSTAVWYRADDSAFTKNVEMIGGPQPISAGTPLNYTLTEADNGKYIRFGVTPRSNGTEGNLGDETFAQLPERVRIPQTKPIVTLLSPRDGYKVYVGNDIQLTASAVCDNTSVTRVEYYANGELCGSAETAPYMVNWSGAPVGDYTIAARAYNALGETGESPAISIRVADLSERTEPVWAQKWTYDFEEFTSDAVYTNATGLTLPGEKPPAVNISTGGTVQSAKGKFDKDANDHHMQINSISGQMIPATVKFDLTNLDQPIDNIVAEMDVAFTTTDETRNIFGYSARLTYYPLSFTNKGQIQYTTNSGNYIFKDENGKDLTYEANRWYHVAIRFDMTTQTMAVYLDGEPLPMEDNVVPGVQYFKDITQIFIEGRHSASQTGVMYIDNLSIGQEQDSYVTSVMTAPRTGYSLKGTDIQFTGYAKDSTGRKIEKVEFYANEQLIAEKPGDSYNFTLPGLPCGVYDIYARAVSESGEEGVSETVRVAADGITLPKMYADGMLLQRNKPIRIAGTGIDGVQVTALLNGDQASTTVAGGKWSLTLPAQAANKNTILTIRTSEGVTHVFNDVAIGELIMCAGQSNMAYTLGAFKNLLPEADKTYEDIRLFVQPEGSSSALKTDVPDGYWTEATPQEAAYYSGMGFLTAKDYYMSQNQEVPVGCIKGSIGGSSINSWIAPGAYDSDPDLLKIKSDTKGRAGNNFNQMINPFADYTIGTVFWYQGEADTLLTSSYEKMMSAFIDSWQEAFRDEMNFIIVQLPIYNYMTAYKAARSAVGVREGQFNVSEIYDNAETVISIDTGDATGIHPSDKGELVHRSSLVLQHFTNPADTGLVWKSPSFDRFEQDGDTMILYFKDVADGLKTKDGSAPRGFKIAGDDGKFADADVTLDGNTIRVDTSKVTGTPRVRYAWEDSPALDGTGKYTTLNLVNSAGLPMAPFRTDRDRYNFKTIDLSTWEMSDPVNFTPQVLWVQADGVIRNGETTITVRARDVDDAVAKVEVYADGSLLGEATRVEDSDLFTYRWVNPAPGSHSLHAIATDTAGTTSVKQDISLGDKTVTPKKYAVTLSQGGGYAIFPFQDLKGNQITAFGGKDGVSVTADTQEDGRLVIAAYDGEDSLLTIKSAEGESVSLTAEELGAAVKVKAFLLDQEMKPLTADREILRTN